MTWNYLTRKFKIFMDVIGLSSKQRKDIKWIVIRDWHSECIEISSFQSLEKFLKKFPDAPCCECLVRPICATVMRRDIIYPPKIKHMIIRLDYCERMHDYLLQEPLDDILA